VRHSVRVTARVWNTAIAIKRVRDPHKYRRCLEFRLGLKAMVRSRVRVIEQGDGVKQSVLEVADEHVRCPHAVELAVMQRDAATVVPLVACERQSLVAPDLTQV